MALHDDELSVEIATVRRLLARDVPQLAGEPLTPLPSSGSSNLLLRLGTSYVVRLPRQPGAGETLRKEARWSPVLSPHLPAALPEFVAVGEPGFGYPEPWAVTRWIDGELPAAGSGSRALASDLAVFVRALRSALLPDAVDAELRWYRGEPLVGIDVEVRDYLEQCRSVDGLALDVDACRALWTAALELPTPVDRGWLHGDLLAENLLVRDGRLAAVLDLGGLSVGCPDVDLVVAWEVLDADARAVFRDEVGVDDDAWLRGRAWALAIAVMTFPYYWTTMPARCADRLVMAQAVLADAV